MKDLILNEKAMGLPLGEYKYSPMDDCDTPAHVTCWVTNSEGLVIADFPEYAHGDETVKQAARNIARAVQAMPEALAIIQEMAEVPSSLERVSDLMLQCERLIRRIPYMNPEG